MPASSVKGVALTTDVTDIPNGVATGAISPLVAFTYRTYCLDPTSSNIPFLSGKFSSISLRALITDPASFGMAYFTEATFTPADWIRRITRPNIHIFICVAHPADLPDELMSIENGDWVGMITQIGPTPKEGYLLPESGAPEPLSDDLETKWYVQHLYSHMLVMVSLLTLSLFFLLCQLLCIAICPCTYIHACIFIHTI
jgi:hypothetical protein